MEWDLSTIIAVSSAALAIISAIVSWRNAARQAAVQYEALRAGMDADVVSWSSEGIEKLAHASSLARTRHLYDAADYQRRLSEVACQLSALADRGRLFFPNHRHDQFGPEREYAFRGLRPPILDALVFACCQIEQIYTPGADDQKAADFLVNCRRLLVSEVQNAVDPRRRKAMMEQLAVVRKKEQQASYEVAHKLAASLEERHPGLPAVTAFMTSYKALQGNA